MKTKIQDWELRAGTKCGAFLEIRASGRRLGLGFALLIAGATLVRASSPDALFQHGVAACRTRDYARAAEAFRASAARQPASGAFQNLGYAEWQRGRAGAAILAWEQALWVNPFCEDAWNNLRFARAAIQVEKPDLTWYEAGSAWLPAGVWAWLASAGVWLAVGAMTLPVVLRRRMSGWHRALVAAGMMVFLLSLPAQFGVQTRSHIGFVLAGNAPLRLTPTQEGQVIAYLAAGEPGRWERERGNYLYVRTAAGAGWVEREQFGLVCAR